MAGRCIEALSKRDNCEGKCYCGMREKSQSPLEFLMSPGLVSQADSSSFTIITYHNFKLHVKSFQIQGTYVSYVITPVHPVYVHYVCKHNRLQQWQTAMWLYGSWPLYHYTAFTTISRDWRHYVYALCCCIAHSSGFRKSYSTCTAQTDQHDGDTAEIFPTL